MSTGGSYVKCKRCGFGEAYSESDLRTRESYYHCKNCGLMGDSNVEGFFVYCEGVQYVRKKRGFSSYGSIEKFTNKTLEDFKKFLEENKDEIEASECYLNQWNGGEVINWVGIGPTLEEDMDRIKQRKEFDYKEAIRCFDEPIRLNSGDALPWGQKGIELCRRGDYERGMSYFDTAFIIDCTFYQAWLFVGIALKKMGRYEEALYSFEGALSGFEEELRLNPGEFMAWEDKGFCLEELKRYEEAEFCYDKAGLV